MGNTKSTSCPNKTSVSEQDLKLTDYDMTIYEKRKERIFKGTLAVCIVYALLALLLMVGSYMFPSLKYVIFESFLPFTIVFIIGTILLIAYLFYNVLNYNPVKVNKNFDYTNISCPDYWTLEFDDELSNYFDSNVINQNLFKYKCVLNKDVFSKYDIYSNGLSPPQFTDSNIGITGYNYNKPSIGLTGASKDSIDDNDNNYLIANIKDDKNRAILNKITGSYDSNIYQALSSASLLMNNYVLDTSSSTNNDFAYLRYFNNADSKDIDPKTITNFNTNKNEKKLNVVDVDNNSLGNSAKLSETDVIKLKKITKLNANEDYLRTFTYGSTGNESTLNNIPLVCNRVYPLLLASIDKDISKATSGKYDENILRCAYSKMCGVPWSDMNCDKYND